MADGVNMAELCKCKICGKETEGYLMGVILKGEKLHVKDECPDCVMEWRRSLIDCQYKKYLRACEITSKKPMSKARFHNDMQSLDKSSFLIMFLYHPEDSEFQKLNDEYHKIINDRAEKLRGE